MTLDPGTRIGPYHVKGLIGAGGIGEMEQEARAAASLSHPNILGVYDVGVGGV